MPPLPRVSPVPRKEIPPYLAGPSWQAIEPQNINSRGTDSPPALTPQFLAGPSWQAVEPQNLSGCGTLDLQTTTECTVHDPQTVCTCGLPSGPTPDDISSYARIIPINSRTIPYLTSNLGISEDQFTIIAATMRSLILAIMESDATMAAQDGAQWTVLSRTGEAIAVAEMQRRCETILTQAEVLSLVDKIPTIIPEPVIVGQLVRAKLSAVNLDIGNICMANATGREFFCQYVVPLLMAIFRDSGEYIDLYHAVMWTQWEVTGIMNAKRKFLLYLVMRVGYTWVTTFPATRKATWLRLVFERKNAMMNKNTARVERITFLDQWSILREHARILEEHKRQLAEQRRVLDEFNNRVGQVQKILGGRGGIVDRNLDYPGSAPIDYNEWTQGVFDVQDATQYNQDESLGPILVGGNKWMGHDPDPVQDDPNPVQVDPDRVQDNQYHGRDSKVVRPESMDNDQDEALDNFSVTQMMWNKILRIQQDNFDIQQRRLGTQEDMTAHMKEEANALSQHIAHLGPG